jgi:hypothetical protein
MGSLPTVFQKAFRAIEMASDHGLNWMEISQAPSQHRYRASQTGSRDYQRRPIVP